MPERPRAFEATTAAFATPARGPTNWFAVAVSTVMLGVPESPSAFEATTAAFATPAKDPTKEDAVTVLSTNSAPVVWAFPNTSNLYAGNVVPMPTLPVV